MNRARCQYPRWQPSRENPDGGCGATPTMAAPLGTSGRFLALCPRCAPHRADAVPLSSVEEP